MPVFLGEEGWVCVEKAALGSGYPSDQLNPNPSSVVDPSPPAAENFYDEGRLRRAEPWGQNYHDKERCYPAAPVQDGQVRTIPGCAQGAQSLPSQQQPHPVPGLFCPAATSHPALEA